MFSKFTFRTFVIGFHKKTNQQKLRYLK